MYEFKTETIDWMISLPTLELTNVISRLSPEKKIAALRDIRLREAELANPVESTYVDRKRKAGAEQSRKQYSAASDIGTIPAIVNQERRDACRYDLHLFEQLYFPHSTGLSPFGDAQIQVLQRIQESILHAGRVLNCEPRGYAKSTQAENAILWAVLYGHRRYAIFFGATSGDGEDAIASIKTELQENDVLFEDFPEVCHAIRKLEGTAQRAIRQTHNGELTHVVWKAETIVLPVIEGSVSSGAIIRGKGYTAATRGARYKRPDGIQMRPDVVVIDDPQTDESAISPTQVGKRLDMLYKTILKLGGHGNKVAAVMNATVIADGDMVDQLANHKLHPEWQSVRVKMLESMPTALESHWLGKYKSLRDNYDPEIVGEQRIAHDRATAFYEANRSVMDAGALSSWVNIPLELGEVSAIQHAMNIYCDDGEDVFASECQNEPRRAIPVGVAHITRDELISRTSGFSQYVVPENTSHIVAHCDVHDAILYWSVVAVQSNFSASIIDYGTFPEQPTKYFNMYNLKRKLQTQLGTASVEEAISSGVTLVTNRICGKNWITPNGEAVHISAMLFDIGYKPEEVSRGIRLSEHSSIAWGARGVGIGPLDKPMTDYDVSPSRVRFAGPSRSRPRWYIPRTTVNGLRVIRFDANYWKSVTAARLMQNRNTSGEWTLFGNHRTDHSHYVDHLASEEPIPTTAKGSTVIQWKARPNQENHWFDTLVGCTVAASLLGVELPGVDQKTRTTPQKTISRKRTSVLPC